MDARSRRRRAGRRRRHHRHLPAVPRPRGGLLGAAARGRRRRRRHLVLEPLPRRPVRLRELHLRLPVLAGAVRRVGVAGALRRAARDRALPQPRGRPVRPPPPHAVRRRRSPSAVYDEPSGTWTVDARRRHRDPRRGSSSPRPACCRCRTSPTCPGATTSAASSTTPGCGRRRRSTSPASASRSSAPGRAACRSIPAIADEVASLTVYQRTANWCTPLNNAPITAEEQAQLRADFEAMRETLNTSVSGFLHPLHDRATFDDSTEERRAFFEKMWNSPGFSKLTSNYTDLLFDAAANAEWCEFIAEKIREHRRRSRDRGEADPEGPPLRREAAAVRHRLLRGVQRPERVARRPRGRRRSCA